MLKLQGMDIIQIFLETARRVMPVQQVFALKIIKKLRTVQIMAKLQAKSMQEELRNTTGMEVLITV